MINPRQTAFEALLKTEKDGAYSNIALDFLLSKSDYGTRDRAFVSNLFYGVIERKLTLDYQLGLYTAKPLCKMKSDLLTILRLGAYQLLFTDKVPPSAAVNESVKLAKKNGLSHASGLVNAVLRKIDKNGLKLPSQENYGEFLSVRYSCPQWLVNKWLKEYGKEATVGILADSLGASKTYIRVNNTRVNGDELIEALSAENVSAVKTDTENCLEIVLGGRSVESLESFKRGLFHVQDKACQLCAAALCVKQGDRVLDLCAAPGGKTYTVAENMKDKGEVLSFDIHPHRVELIKGGAERLGLKSVKALQGDALCFNKDLGEADAVLCDVPCSGFGIIGRKPEIKYKNPDEVKALPALQLEILQNGAKYVKKGGRLVYSTCTLSHSENQKVCRKFLESTTDFKAVSPLKNLTADESITFFPHINGTDGFFIACFERINGNEN